jgi:general secretion pathway protein G
MQNKQKGFTLIELLVVIAIIGLLSTLAVVALNSARQKSRDSKRVADIKQIQTALELYYADNNGYPAMASATEIGLASTRTLCGTGTFSSSCSGTTYMGLVPAKASPNDGSCSVADNQYMYTSAATSSYTITFCLGGQVGDLPAGLHTANPNGIQ